MKIKEESAIHAVNKVNIIQHKSYIPKQLKKTYWRLRDQLRWQYRLLTWRSWALPDFNIIGVMKSGTKSLFYDVAQQSQLIHSTKKEIRVSQKNEISWREQAWYRTPFYLTVLYLYDIVPFQRRRSLKQSHETCGPTPSPNGLVLIERHSRKLLPLISWQNTANLGFYSPLPIKGERN